MNTAPQDGAAGSGGTTTGRQALTGDRAGPGGKAAPADRYQAITATEDLGLGYPPEDDTDDLVGVNENAPSRKVLADPAEGNESSTYGRN